MPRIYLSPSLQEYNKYLTGGTEEEYMNIIADKMVPYLNATGIEYDRNSPEQTLSEVINDSNKGDYDLHVALHSNASPENLKGKLSGSDIYYWYGSTNGKKFADIVAKYMKEIYPDPEKVKTIPTGILKELNRTSAPSVIIETAYHDNPQDEQWIKENTESIAIEIVKSLAEYFGIPFKWPAM